MDPNLNWIQFNTGKNRINSKGARFRKERKKHSGTRMKASFFQQHYLLNVRFSSETIVYSFVSILITADPDWAKILDPDRVLSWELPRVPG